MAGWGCGALRHAGAPRDATRVQVGLGSCFAVLRRCRSRLRAGGRGGLEGGGGGEIGGRAEGLLSVLAVP